MPANLPPQYLKAEDEYRKASTPEKRLEKLRELFRLLPKHKGTEKLQSDLKQKMSQLKEEQERGKPGGKKAGLSHHVPREGAGQVMLIGPPNVGKSTLLAALTNARPEIAPYPFTTRAPQPGIMMWQDVPVQLVDLPAISSEFVEPWVPDLIRSADAALLVADLASDDVAEATLMVLERLAASHAELVGELPHDVEDESIRHLKTVMVATKLDASGAGDRLEVVREWFAPRFPVVPVSALTGEGLETLRAATYHLLGVLRVYTKVPGKPADRTRPFTLPIGSTVLDLAREIHRDFELSLKSARIWGTGVFDGQAVKRDHELHDGDVVELHVA
ncbi:MAG TPA: GTPase [Isosphaeraceae bacterium]|nr:GTPase [Isosphaeraceae bacterium]